MKHIFILILLLIPAYLYSQDRIGLIKNDSLVCCKTIRGVTADGEVFPYPVIYTGQFAIDSIDGYPKFVWSIVGSSDGITWNVVGNHTDTVTMADLEYGTDVNSWDTLVMETTSIAIEYLGLQLETIDSVQAIKLKGDLNFRIK